MLAARTTHKPCCPVTAPQEATSKAYLHGGSAGAGQQQQQVSWPPHVLGHAARLCAAPASWLRPAGACVQSLARALFPARPCSAGPWCALAAALRPVSRRVLERWLQQERRRQMAAGAVRAWAASAGALPPQQQLAVLPVPPAISGVRRAKSGGQCVQVESCPHLQREE